MMPEPVASTEKLPFGFRVNPMDKLFVSHGGLSSLCFDRNAFFEESFNVDVFLSHHTQRGIPLEVLKDDLATYRKILQSALIQLIDREYADFVHLSSSLVGIDKNIEKLRRPVEHHLLQVTKHVADIDSHLASLDAKIQRRIQIQTHKRQLQSLLSAMENMETLIYVDRTLSETLASRDRFPLLCRMSDLLLRIYTEEEKLSSATWLMSVKERLIFADASFTKVLGSELLNALKSKDAKVIQQYCLIYIHLSRINLAYQVLAEGAVKPTFLPVIRDIQLRKAGLSVLFRKLYSIIEEDFYALVYVDRADFVLESLWSTLARLLATEAHGFFTPDQADEFQLNYRETKRFMADIIRLYSGARKNVADDFWKHPATAEFLEKWSLPVYYQVRFLEIGAPLEEALTDTVKPSSNSNSGFSIAASEVLWGAVRRCYDPEVCLDELAHRFWKLILLLLARYRSWLNNLIAEGNLAIQFLSGVITDVGTLKEKFVSLPNIYATRFANTDSVSSAAVILFMSESLQDTISSYNSLERLLLDKLSTSVADNVADVLRSVQEIPRLYRRTNREVPSLPSPYVDSAFENLITQFKQKTTLSESQRTYSYIAVLNQVLKLYGGFALDLLDAVRRMEDSLKKLRKTRFAADTSAGMSDDDKIRLQLALDILQMQEKIVALGIQPSQFEEFTVARERILAERPGQES